MEAVVLEIEGMLQLERLPGSPEPAPQGGDAPLGPQDGDAPPAPQGGHAPGYQVGKLLHSIKTLVERQNEDAVTVDPRDEAFVEYAKSVSTSFASLCNTINIFGATTSWLIGDNSQHLNKHKHMRMVFIVLALIFLPFSLITVGMASSMKPKRSMHRRMNTVALMLFTETAYMGVMCGFFGYYLINDADIPTVALLAGIGAAVLIFVPWIVYRRPRP